MKYFYRYLCKFCNLLWRKKDLDKYTVAGRGVIRVCPKCGVKCRKISNKDRKMGDEE